MRIIKTFHCFAKIVYCINRICNLFVLLRFMPLLLHHLMVVIRIHILRIEHPRLKIVIHDTTPFFMMSELYFAFITKTMKY